MEPREYMRIFAGVQAHLRGNFYPPAKPEFISPTYKAVLACINGNPEEKIELYDGYTLAKELVEFFRLEDFVMGERGEEYE